MVRPRVLSLAAALCTAACTTTSAEVRDAAAGRLAGLDARVAASVQRGALGNDQALELARAVVAGEVARSRGRLGVDDIRRLGPCVRPLKAALEKRADTRDEVGAAAAMELVEAGVDGPGSFDAEPNDPIGAWRAVAVRGLTDSSDGPARRQKMLDPDEDVRLAAFRAAALAVDEADIEPVLEAARVDPNLRARGQAVRAAGLLGGERVVLALRDLWAQAEEPIRVSIADAWASPRSLEAGGRRELAWAANAARGGAQIAAAYALVRAGGVEAGEGAAVLEQAIHTGPAKDRIFAIMVAPPKDEAIRAALKKASDDTDELVAVAAIERRLEVGAAPADAQALTAKLMKIAAGTTRSAINAKTALARAGHAAVAPILTRDVKSTDARLREAGGVGFALLRDYPHAAVVAVDKDRDARTRVACAMLTAKK